VASRSAVPGEFGSPDPSLICLRLKQNRPHHRLTAEKEHESRLHHFLANHFLALLLIPGRGQEYYWQEYVDLGGQSSVDAHRT
jgi:hypothetical protein